MNAKRELRATPPRRRCPGRRRITPDVAIVAVVIALGVFLVALADPVSRWLREAIGG